MVKINSSRLKKLSQYSIASIAFIAASDCVNAQIVYTELEPDIIIDAPNDFYELDLDNNGIIDFFISATSASFVSTTEDGVFNNFMRAVIADPGSGNYIAGVDGMEGFAYPFAMENAEVIDGISPMQNDAFQSLAYSFYAIKNASTVFNILSVGEWFNGETDKFLGFKFLIGTEYHYGWARLDVHADNNAFTIKSFAYESLANTGIETDLDFVPIETIGQNEIVTMYCFNNVLYTHTLKPPVSEMRITVSNINGSEVFTSTMNAHNSTFNLSQLPAGLYLVQILNDGIIQTKKIFLE